MSRIAFTFMAVSLIAASSLVQLAPPAVAQIGNIFSDRPRPPSAVPRGSNNGDQLQEPDEEDVPELPQGKLLPAPGTAPGRPAPGQGVPPPAAVQSQPLPPPPGGAPKGTPGVASAPPGPNPLPGLPPGQKQPRGTTAPPSPATLQPGDEIVTEPPAVKIVNKRAVFSGLDKITGRIINFDAAIGETVQFGALRIKPDACYTRPATESANTDAFVEVDEITLQNEVKRIFSGWMFAASPGLHGVEHPIYDVWLTDCKSPETTVTAQTNDPAKPVAPAAPTPAAAQPQKRPPVQRPPGTATTTQQPAQRLPTQAPAPAAPNPFPGFR
ncbi:MAG: DUF2155 domain-containing protein [Bradyrhizobiaceae bacterium]|nr:MAG: DUF2155 domain-containing protein [Bradyrhizobiaceae bacterium]